MNPAPPATGTSDWHTLIDPSAPFHVAGHRGLVGSAIWRHLEQRGHSSLLGLPSSELDLRNRADVFDFYATYRPRYAILAAAKVGGIGANSTLPAEFITDNLQIQTSVLDAAHAFGVERLLFLGSSCIYPKFAEQPIRESSLLGGPLEPSNQAYAVAKIAGIVQVQSMRSQYGDSFISAMPTNLYGPGDNFDLSTSHVLPAMIRRFHEAARDGAPKVTLWGSGTPRREFLHVDDLAEACYELLGRYDDPSPINVGTGTDLSIRELAELVAGVVGYQGELAWDSTKLDGTPRKVLDVSRINGLGWQASISLAEGVAQTYEWFAQRAQDPSLRN